MGQVDRAAARAHLDRLDGRTDAYLASASDLRFAPLATRLRADPLGLLDAPLVDGDAVLLPGMVDLEHTTLMAHSPGAAPFRVPLPRDPMPAAAAGGRVAVLAPRRHGRRYATTGRIAVLDWRTGAELRSVPVDDRYFTDVALAADGTVAWTVITGVDGDRVRVAPASGPESEVRATRSASLRHPVLAGDRVAAIVYDHGERYVAAAPITGGPLRRIGPVGFDVDDLVGDGDRLAWTADGCVVTASASSGPTAALPPGPCARTLPQVVGDQQVAVSPSARRIRVRVRCLAAPAAGCAGVVVVRGRRTLLGRARFTAIPVGQERPVPVPLTRAGSAAVRRALRGDGRATARATATGIDPAGRHGQAGCGCLRLRRRGG